MISDPFKKLKNTKLKNPNRLIIAQLNINSVRNKLDSLVRMLDNNLDILLFSETKIVSSFPAAQFQIESYTTYRLDRNANSGGILLYIWEDIPSTLLNSNMSIENFSIEINMRKKKWLSVCTYNPNKNFQTISKKQAKTWTIIPQNMTTLFFFVILIRSQQNQQ